MRTQRDKKRGFTLIELLVALAIFSLVAAMAAGTFWSITKAWKRGGEMLEQLHYGEFAMEQLVTALRGASWFPSKPEAFGFWMESQKASWVTSGTAFLPPDSPLRNGLHRISVKVDSVQGERGLVVRVWPHLTEDAHESDGEAFLVCPEVEEFSCEWYDFETEGWSQNWEETNSLPKLVRVTLKMKKRKEFDESLEMQRLVELEVAPEIPGRERRDRTVDSGRRSEAVQHQNQGAPNTFTPNFGGPNSAAQNAAQNAARENFLRENSPQLNTPRFDSPRLNSPARFSPSQNAPDRFAPSESGTRIRVPLRSNGRFRTLPQENPK